MPRTVSILLLSLIVLRLCGILNAQSYGGSSHGNKANLPAGCATCHQGHGITGTAMLKSAEEETCYFCHGNLVSRNSAIQGGQLSSGFVNMEDISLVMRKKFTHFASTFGLNNFKRESKESCSGCHNPHYAGSPNRYQGIPGVTLQGTTTPQVAHEYEVCFRCHSQLSESVESSFRDIRLEFDRVTAISSHPVDRPVLPGKFKSISLIDTGREYTLTCSSCHGNSEVQGPQGIHGSDYPYLLKKNLETDDYVPDTPNGGDLCYSCHKRESIMANESFSYHAEHVDGTFSATPCLTCHSGHGSLLYSSLIAFNSRVVSPLPTAQLMFESTGKHSGMCSLTCHNAKHEGWAYSGNAQQTTTAAGLKGSLAAPQIRKLPTTNRGLPKRQKDRRKVPEKP